MGETISTLVFRPPSPTYIRPNRYFYIEVPIETDLSCISTTCGMVSRKGRYNNQMMSGPHKIPAFFIKRRGARITFLFSHGNAEDLGMMYNRMKELARVMGVNVLAYDYTGYGLSTGQPSEEMCYRNIVAAYNYLRYERNTPASHIVLYGRSLGSGPSCYLAKKTADEGESIAGLILHSPFLSIYRIVMDCGFNLMGDMFKNKTNARGVKCPVLIIHGTKDEVVPFWHGDQLLQSFPSQCRAQPFWVNGLGHNNIEVFVKKEYVFRIVNFLNRYVAANRQSPSSNLSNKQGQAFEPMSVPESERYVSEQSLMSSGKFYVNKTWVKHGADIISEAVSSKKMKEAKQKTSETKRGNFRKTTQNGVCGKENVSEAEQERLDQLRPSPGSANIDDDQSTASRFVVTRDRIVQDNGEDSDEEERELHNDKFSSHSPVKAGKRDQSMKRSRSLKHVFRNNKRQPSGSPKPSGRKIIGLRFPSKSPSRRKASMCANTPVVCSKAPDNERYNELI